MKQLEKRKRVMARSIKLGHCVCDPKQPCPCPLFKEEDICTCAGEHMPADDSQKPVRLTEHIRSAGCASKISQQDLHRVLSRLPPVQDPRLLVGMATADDAGVFALTPEVNLVQTVDVFTPTVDDAFLFGQIAACNSLSDVYAMGGRPVTALSIIGFPIHKLPHEVMAEILRGGMSKLAEASVILLGGHSIDDEEIKFGFAVTGVVEKKQLVTNAGAQPGDALILTKPLGTGIVSFAGQIGRASEAALRAATESMCALNQTAAELMGKYEVHACTDVTGFGLLGHLARLVQESGVTAEIQCAQLPLLPSVLEYAKAGLFSGANERNAEYSESITTLDKDVTEEFRAMLYDAQTSGGLLISLSAGNADSFLKDLHGAGVASASIIGAITEKSKGFICVHQGARILRKIPAPVVAKTRAPPPDRGCPHGMESAAADSAMKPGAIDVVAKVLMAIALSLAANCSPCARSYIKRALGMGLGKAELEEAASLAALYGGSQALALWKQMEQELLKPEA